MDAAQQEKKWFVYLTDHHEGPFSLTELQVKLSQGLITTGHYVWAEGLNDWKPMTEVSEMDSILSPTASSQASIPQSAPQSSGTNGSGVVLLATEAASRPDIQLVDIPKEEPGPAQDDSVRDPREIEVSEISIEPQSKLTQSKIMPTKSRITQLTQSQIVPTQSKILPTQSQIVPTQSKITPTGTQSRTKTGMGYGPSTSTHTGVAMGGHGFSDAIEDLPLEPTDSGLLSPSGGESIPLESLDPAILASVMSGAPREARGYGWLIKPLLLIGIPGGIAGAYYGGYLDETLKSPAVKASLQAASDFAQPHLLKLTEKFPELSKWVSPIPRLEDVSPEDYLSLKEAATQDLVDGPKIAVALSTTNTTAPQFYVSSNMPDGTMIDVYAEGIADTLLNHLSFHGKVHAAINKKLGKTGVVRFADGKPLPRGEYVVYATEGSKQPEATKAMLAKMPAVTAKTAAALPKQLKLLVSKPAFLGGAKDKTYVSRLKEYHDKLRAKAKAEVDEIKQIQATLESQLLQTNTKYAQLHGMTKGGRLTPAARKAWMVFNTQWLQLESEIRKNYLKWTDQALESEYYYGVLYAMTKTTGDAVDKLHQLHANFFSGRANTKGIEIQRGSAVANADEVMSKLKNKVAQIESLAPTPNGMPRREGL